MRAAKETDNLELTAWRSLADTYRLIYGKVNSDLRGYGLTPPQYSVLRSIGRSESGSLSMSRISKELLVSFADVTVIVDNLENHGYVKRIRKETDRRIVRVDLTTKGRRLWRKISALHGKKVADLMGGLTKQELNNLTEDTTKIRNRILLNLRDLQREGQ